MAHYTDQEKVGYQKVAGNWDQRYTVMLDGLLFSCLGISMPIFISLVFHAAHRQNEWCKARSGHF